MAKALTVPPPAIIWGKYLPFLWFEGDKMYATCGMIQGRDYIDISTRNRKTFESRLVHALKIRCDVLASNVTLFYHNSGVEIIFNDDEEFVMAKMVHDVK
jgi:hypothetical protein